jgi:hypothetical protein
MSEMASEQKRAAQRRRVLLGGRLVYSPAELTVECAIVDISESGARVRISGAPLLVEPLYLVNLTHGRAFKARLAWRRANLLGLAFSEAYDLREPPPELPKIVRQVWVEQTRA